MQELTYNFLVRALALTLARTDGAGCGRYSRMGKIFLPPWTWLDSLVSRHVSLARAACRMFPPCCRVLLHVFTNCSAGLFRCGKCLPPTKYRTLNIAYVGLLREGSRGMACIPACVPMFCRRARVTVVGRARVSGVLCFPRANITEYNLPNSLLTLTHCH